MDFEFKPQGYWEVVSRNKHGEVDWVDTIENGVTLAGLTDVLSTAFASGTQRSWYFGLIDNLSFSAVSAADTMSSHSGWTELTSYSSATRQAWSSLSVAAAIAYNPTQVVITFSATCDVKGIFLSSNDTKGGTTGILWSTGLFSSARHKQSGETLSLTYRIRGAGGS